VYTVTTTGSRSTTSPGTAVNLAAENTEKDDDPTIGSRVLDGTDQTTE
jgi:hypothetical protein